MIQMINVVLIFLFSLGVSGNNSIIQPKKKYQQGISGVVLWRSGNLMPSPDLPAASIKGKPISREVIAYKLTKTSEATQNGTFFSALKTVEVGRTKSDSTGHFFLKLPAGNYSLFITEEKGLFANRFDGQNNICPVQVQAGKITCIELIVDYAANY